MTESNAMICTIERVASRGSTQETLLTLAVPQEHASKVAGFLTRIGDHVGVAFAEVTNTPRGPAASAPPAESQAGGRTIGLAEHLHRAGYFRNIKLWEALDVADVYTQAEHKEWVESQHCYFRHADYGVCAGPAMVSRDAMVVCAHHVTGAALPAAGKGSNPRKPPHWFTLPMCDGHHTWVHNKDCTREDKERLVVAAVDMMAGQAKAAVKLYLGLDSLANATLEQLNRMEREFSLPVTSWAPR